MKVDEQAQLPSAKLEITEQLSVVDREQSFDGFHFYNDYFRDQKVQPITAVETDSFVIDVKRLLRFEGNFPERKLVRQTLFVSGF